MSRVNKISTDVLLVLTRAVTEGNKLRIVELLDRKLYAATNKVLDAAGGKWNRSAGAHIFQGDAAEAIEPLVLTGEYNSAPREAFDFFPTPAALAARAVDLAGIVPGMRALEPQAGGGRIARELAARGAHVTAVELDERHKDLGGLVQDVRYGDFLNFAPEQLGRFDAIVMNPPFSRQADLVHVTHATSFLAPGGRLVAIMSNGITFRDNRATVQFRDLLACHAGKIEVLPEGSFRESGTGVNTVLVTMRQ